MSIFPITPLVRQVQSLILGTFDVSEQPAQDYAAELVSLAEVGAVQRRQHSWIGRTASRKTWARNCGGSPRPSEPPPRCSAPRQAAIRECLVCSTAAVGGGRSPLALE